MKFPCKRALIVLKKYVCYVPPLSFSNFLYTNKVQIKYFYYHKHLTLKDKSWVRIIVDYSRDYTVVNGVSYFFNCFLF